MKPEELINYQKILSEVVTDCRQLEDIGNVASYIPELRNIDPNKFGVHLTTIDNQNFGLGDSTEKFSIQSIAKVLALTLALKLEGGNLWRRVGVEPSGTAFNSLVQLEYENGIPRNPFINAGALVICDILISHLKKPKYDFLEFTRNISENPSLNYCPRIAESEKLAGFRNAALINLMKSYGNINNDIDIVLDFYFTLCSLEMSCQELAHEFLFLALNGVNPITNQQIISSRRSKRINAIMQLCGFYDEAGEFSFKVGLPGKSGVGGGIIAIHPGNYSIAVWSPKLNIKGNSYKGMKALGSFTTKTRSSIF